MDLPFRDFCFGIHRLIYFSSLFSMSKPTIGLKNQDSETVFKKRDALSGASPIEQNTFKITRRSQF